MVWKMSLLKKFSWLLLGVVWCGAQNYNDVTLEDVVLDNSLLTLTEESNEIESREFFMSWQARRALRRVLLQMPCGWPEYGIPPLAPYTKDQLIYNYSNNFTSSFIQFHPLRIDGLNNVDIDKVSISFTLQKAYFNLNFPNITATGKFNFSAVFNTMMDRRNMTPSMTGLGDLDFSLQDLRIEGSFRYRTPLIFGSAKVYNLKTSLTLGAVVSKLKGSINSTPISPNFNRMIELTMLEAFNENNIFLNAVLSQLLEPRVNTQLKGKKLWNIISWSLANANEPCLRDGMRTDELQQLYL